MGYLRRYALSIICLLANSTLLVRNTGDCRYSSEFNVYRIKATTGEVLERSTAREAHAKYGDDDLPMVSK